MKSVISLINEYLTSFSVGCFFLAVVSLCLAVICIIIGIITHEPYNNNKTSFKTCKLFLIFAGISWVLFEVLFAIELICNFIKCFGEASAFNVAALPIYFILIAVFGDIARRIFSNEGRYVGHVTPYERFLRYMKPIFWED